MNPPNTYPIFQITDQWGRQLRYERHGDKYLRTWLNNPHTLDRQQAPENISRHAYASALLYYLEGLDNQEQQPFSARLPEPQTEAQQDLDEWFGPRDWR